MAGLAGAGVSPDATRRQRLWHGARRVLAYQTGRAVMYGILGAGAGMLGHAIEGTVQGVAKIAGLLVAVFLLGAGLWQMPKVRGLFPGSKRQSGASWTSRAVGAVLGTMNRAWPEALPGRMVGVGFLMGLLPCMLMFWVLSLSASTAHPGHGAAIMVLLVAMTSPVLVIAGCGPLLAKPSLRSWGQRALPWAVCFSGVWLGLISVAANGWIEHVYFDFAIEGRDYYFMLW